MADPAITSAIFGAATAIVAGIITLLLARRAGLTDIQKEVESEGQILIGRLKERVTLLEADLAAEKARTTSLQAQNAQLRERVDALEERLADILLTLPKGPKGDRGERGMQGPRGGGP